MEKGSKILLSGHTGLVGGAILKRLQADGYTDIITEKSNWLDLTDKVSVHTFFRYNLPEYVFLAAAKVGGIKANNQYRADFITKNIEIQTNVISAAHEYGVKKLLFLGSSCIYPKDCEQPIKEEYLLTGPLEQSNEPYAIAKIAGLKMIEAYRDQYGCNFISVMPSNVYGSERDNYDPENSHMIAALIRKFHEATVNNLPSVEIWGTGKPFRELLHADDLADACVMLMNNYDERQFINIGTGEDMTVKHIAELIKEITGYQGEMTFNGQLDGTYRKLLDTSRINALGWHAKISPDDGLRSTYELYKNLLK